MTFSVRCKCSFLFLLLYTAIFAEDCCINPPARCLPADCSGILVFVDPLLWKGQIGGAGIAITTEGDTLFDGKKSQVSNLDFSLDWGVRIGLGYNTSYDGWETLLIWTHFQTEAKRSVGVNYPIWGQPAQSTSFIALDGKGKWKLSYNTLDLENARSFYVGNCFILRPHGGLRSAWINQKEYDISYTFGEQIISMRDRSWGIGIRGGLDMQWVFGCGFSLFSNYAGSLLYSYHSVKNTTIFNFYHIGNAIFDAQIGLSYNTTICNSCLNLDIGWENHWLPNQNQFMLFVDDAMPGKFVQNQGDLGITGLFFRIRYDF